MKHGSPVWIVWLEAFRILDLMFSFYIVFCGSAELRARFQTRRREDATIELY